MIRGVVNSGTGRRVRGYGIRADMGGKTGTTNSNADGWFMGVVPKLVVGCWVGGEDMDVHFSSMSNGQGAAAALPIFGLFMKKVYADDVLNKRYGISQSDKFQIPKDFDECDNELTGLQVPEGGDDIDESEKSGDRRSLRNGTTYHTSNGSKVIRRPKKSDSSSNGDKPIEPKVNHSSESSTTQQHEVKPVAPPPPPREGHIDESFN